MAISETLAALQQNFAETKPDMKEIASSEDNLYLKGTIIPYNPDTLLGRKGFPIYDQMRIDDQVKACLTLKKFATLAPNYEIIPASNDEQDIEVADFVTYCFEKMQGSMIDNVLEIMTALDYGYSITEINYKTFTSGKYDGKIGLANLKTKQPYYYRFAVDEYANLLKDGIVYDRGGAEDYYPTSKFLIFSYQKEFGNHYGTSDLRPAYRGYWSKDVLIKMWNIYLERFANPTVVGKYKSNDPSGRTNLRNILDNLTAKTSITHRMDEFDIGLLESNRASTNDFNTALNFYNKSIARSILIPDRLMAEGDTGAYAQAKIHFDVFLWIIQKLRQDIEESVMNEQLIKRLVAYNFSNVEELPQFKFNPMTDDQKLQLQTLFITAVEKGVVVPTLEDENVLRRQLNFPEKDLDVETADSVVEETPDEEVIEEETETVIENTTNMSEPDTKPTSSMKEEADRGLAWRKELNRGGTRIGVARANQLSNRENLSISTIKRMYSYFSRHEVDKQGQGYERGEDGYPSAGRIAWALWGGDAGFSWSRRIVEHLKNHNEPQPHKHYAKTKAEKRVDFATVEKTLDKLDNDFEQSVITVMTKQMEAVKTYIKNKMTKNEFDFTAIDNLDLKFKSELIQKFEDGYANAYSVGKKEARDSLPKKFLKTQIGVGILTAGFKRYFKSKARLDVKKISATLTNDMMGILLNSLTRGTSIPKTTIAIQQGFNPYIADGTEISSKTGKAMTGYRTTAIVRTANLGAYNFGRREVGDDKDVKDFIIGYQLSAVLDGETSEVCELVAELEPQIRIEDEGLLNDLTPPLHYNCRTILVFMTKEDLPVEWSDESDLYEIIDLSGMTE
jgi:phage gp29-like protein|tara:strand:- start:2980 stop:5517 length:2538 start_codon:yes stop_codon:yes gene_type:complete